MLSVLDATTKNNGVEAQMSPKLIKLSSLFARVFPEWNKGIYNVSAAIISDIQKIALRHDLFDTTPILPGAAIEVAQVIPFAVEHKMVDLIGTIGGTVQGDLEGKEEFVREDLGRVVFLLLDVPDTLGDSVGIRDRADTNILFSFAEYVFTGVKAANLQLTDPKYQPLIQFLDEYAEETKKGVDRMFAKLSSRESEAKARAVIVDMIRQYRGSVSIMHIQDSSFRAALKNYYLQESVAKGREILPWLRNPDFWVLSQITTLGILGVLNEVSTKADITVKDLAELETYYDQVTSFTLIALDGIKDLKEDEVNGDPNLFQELLEGKHKDHIGIMESQYGQMPEYARYENDNELAAKYFYALVGRAYLEKEAALISAYGKERSYKHQKMFRDMVKFYSLQLMMDGKGPETIESKCMKILSEQIGEVTN